MIVGSVAFAGGSCGTLMFHSCAEPASATVQRRCG